MWIKETLCTMGIYIYFLVLFLFVWTTVPGNIVTIVWSTVFRYWIMMGVPYLIVWRLHQGNNYNYYVYCQYFKAENVVIR